jgi:nitroreductase
MPLETFAAVASQRDTRSYRNDPVPVDLTQRILDAGRIAGSGKNRQGRRFIVVTDAQAEASQHVTRPGNVLGAALVVAIAVPAEGTFAAFDAARAAQNMMLTAWSEGVASCPNALTNPDAVAALLGLGADERVATLVSFGYPANGRSGNDRTPDEWLDRADRRPLEEVVEHR